MFVNRCLFTGAVWLWLIVLTATAQTNFESWTTKDGLPQDYVRSIAKTPDGYLWFGTIEGLVRFDGVNFTVFDNINTKEFKQSAIYGVITDRLGNLWVGLPRTGLIKRSDDQFTVYTTADGLINNAVVSLLEDRDGGIWIGTDGGGLSLFKDEKFTNFKPQDGLPDATIWALAEDNDGGIWIGTANGLSFFKDGKFTLFTTKDGLSANNIASLWWSKTDGLWIGTTGGLSRLQDDKFIIFAAQSEISDQKIETIFEDKNNNLWLGTISKGLYRVFRDGRVIPDKTLNGSSQTGVYSIYQDSDETIWLGTYALGLYRFRAGRFRILTTADGLPEDEIRAVYEDKRGNLWFSTSNKLNRMKDGKITVYSMPETLQKRIRSITEDAAGNLWIGGTDGISCLKDGKFTSFTTKDGLSFNNVVTVLGDRAGNVWIGTSHGSVNKFDGEKFTVYTLDNEPFNKFVLNLFEDSRGRIWIGTLNGLSRYENGQITNWKNEDGAANNHILSFYEDAKGVIWIGTSGGGLMRYKDEKFVTITSRNGLYDNLTFTILEDEKRNLWMCGNKGLYRANLDELNDFADGLRDSVNSYSYGTDDGMLSRECNGASPAGWKTRDGKLWFPTVKGLVGVDSQQENSLPPTVLIEKVVLDKNELAPGDFLEINPGQENLEIKYTALSWKRPKQIKFKYQLVGLDRDWIDAGTRRTAYYSYLPPGEYAFRVIADNGDGVWNETGKSLRIKVFPPFYRTWWFSALLFLVFFGLLSAVFRYRVSQIEKKRRTQEEFSRKLLASQESERQRIAAELHDTLGQSLLIIKNRVALAQTDIDEKETVEEQLSELSQSATAAIEECREIAYNLRPYQLSRFGLSRTLAGIFNRIGEVTPIKATAEIDDIDDFLSAEAEISVYRIVQESVNNIIKHSGASEALLAVKRSGDEILLLVEDNGRGFAQKNEGSAQPGKSGGFGLIGIAERVKMLHGSYEINSASGSGTSIRIKLNRSFQNNGS